MTLAIPYEIGNDRLPSRVISGIATPARRFFPREHSR
jgi:hypothetical protein